MIALHTWSCKLPQHDLARVYTRTSEVCNALANPNYITSVELWSKSRIMNLNDQLENLESTNVRTITQHSNNLGHCIPAIGLTSFPWHPVVVILTTPTWIPNRWFRTNFKHTNLVHDTTTPTSHTYCFHNHISTAYCCSPTISSSSVFITPP